MARRQPMDENVPQRAQVCWLEIESLSSVILATELGDFALFSRNFQENDIFLMNLSKKCRFCIVFY